MNELEHIIKLLEQQGKILSKIADHLESKQDDAAQHVTIKKSQNNVSANKLLSIGTKLEGKVDEIGQQGLIILALYYKPKQSKENLLNVLLSWGIKKTIHKWFKGSNFKHRLLDTGVIVKVDVDSNDQDLFSLTVPKGIPRAKELIEKYAL